MAAPDVLVVGAGMFGLSVAWAARRAGLTVQVLESHQVGAGASGGVVGALMPHAPGKGGVLAEFQIASLLALPDHLAEIEQAAGQGMGFGRVGRVTPLVTAKARVRAEAEAQAAAEWPPGWTFEIRDRSDGISPDASQHGVIVETATARVNPRLYLSVLSRVLHEDLLPGRVVTGIDFDRTIAMTAGGAISAGQIVLANGAGLWPLLPDGVASGDAVKGQAALLRPSKALGLGQVVYASGLFIVPHQDGTVAVGSTSETSFSDPTGTDDQLEQVLDKARAMVPALRGAEVIARWAGLRPRAASRLPIAGVLPGHPRVHVAGGGYKIGFAIAHTIGQAVVAGITGREAPVSLPPEFAPETD